MPETVSTDNLVNKDNPVNKDSAVIKLLQITDSHLTKDPDSDLLGVNTRESLDAVMKVIRENGEQPDHILATGDLAQDGSAEAYRYFQTILSEFNCAASWFPGNHDARMPMKSVVGKGKELEKVIRFGNWQFVLLDSLVEGKVHGWLEDGELDVLEKALKAAPELHTLVCLHHHPVDIGSTWLDKIGLHNRDALLDIVDAHDNVRAILWGHIHQQVDEERNGVKLMATPSTCIQFMPKSHDFAVEDVAPGYRWLRLYSDGSIESEVVRATDYEFNLDLNSTGY